MSDLAKQIQIHFIDDVTGDMVLRRVEWHAPRVGDEIRFGGEGAEKYYKVNRLVWCYDEPTAFYSRLNVGVTLSTGDK